MFEHSCAKILRCCPPAKQVHNQRNRRYNQKQMNSASHQMESDPHHQPDANQHKEQDKEQEIANQPHVILLHV
jgi:hypothetical protein